MPSPRPSLPLPSSSTFPRLALCLYYLTPPQRIRRWLRGWLHGRWVVMSQGDERLNRWSPLVTLPCHCWRRRWWWCCCHVLDAINIVLPQLVLDIFHMASTFVSSISTSASTFNDLSEEEPYVTMLEGKTLEDYIPRNHDHHFREQLEEGIFYAFEIFMVALRGCQEHVKQQATHTGLNSLNAQRYRERQGDIECT